MIRVKDTNRLKAFDFEEKKAIDVFYKLLTNSTDIHNTKRAAFLTVDKDKIFIECEVLLETNYANIETSFQIPLDDIFDLQAAGLLERVED